MSSEHRRHDRLLVTRFAMDDAYPSETAEARQLIDSCAECAALAADIRALSSSMSQLPDAKRTRDFTITAEKAEELRGSRISRWMRGLATPKFGMLRPVAGVALSIGLVMAIVGVAMPWHGSRQATTPLVPLRGLPRPTRPERARRRIRAIGVPGRCRCAGSPSAAEAPGLLPSRCRSSRSQPLPDPTSGPGIPGDVRSRAELA